MEKLIDRLEENPIIAAVKNNHQLEAAIHSENEVIFLLAGDIFNLKETVKRVKENNKMCFVHFDLIDGIGKNTTALEYVMRTFQPDGIISTKANIISNAKKLGALTIHRHFVIDSMSLQNTIEMIKEIKPHAIEVLPGVIHEAILKIKEETHIPIIAGGLISEKEHIVKALSSGAVGISSTNEKIWKM